MKADKETLIIKKHYPALDGLRGIAILLVVLFHASEFAYDASGTKISSFAENFAAISIIGLTGIDLFFVLSGFLITGILIDTRNETYALKNFYIRRALRIFPVYFLTLALVLLYAVSANQEIDSAKILTHLIYIQNISLHFNEDVFIYLNHTWSLAIEVQFYLIWSLILVWSYKKSPLMSALICTSLITFAAFMRLYLTNEDLYKLAYTTTFARMDALCMGALISICIQSNYNAIKKHQDTINAIMMASAVILLIIVVFSENAEHAINNIIKYGLTCSTLLYGGLILSLLMNNENILRFKKILCLKYLRKIGCMSYGIYLFHVPILFVIGKALHENSLGFGLNYILILGGGGAITIIAANLSYKYFEKPILKLKDKYAPHA